MGASELLQTIRIGAGKLAERGVSDVGEATDFIRKNPVTSGVGVAGGILAGATIVQIARKRKKKTTTSKKKKKSTKKTTKRKTKKKPAKRKRAGTKAGGGVYTAKNGTKYIRLANGKVRFISNKSASMRKKRKGGYR